MREYNNIDQRIHIHQLSQILAKFGRSFADYKTTPSLTVGKWMISEHWKGGTTNARSKF
jgi:hypothetical protein